MNNKELFYFTGKCLTLDERPALRSVILEKIYAGQIDWNRFVWLCSNHLILQVIYLKFKSHDILSEIPDNLTNHLKLVHHLNCDRNTALLQQAADIAVALNKENISPVFMKGTGNLLSGLYQDIGERMIGDIDFLVPETYYLKAVHIVLGMGYKQNATNTASLMSSKHYPRLFREDVPANIEIHRLPVTKKYSTNFNAEMMLRDKERVTTLQSCHVPSEEHKIIQNFIHSQFEHQGYQLASVSLRDVYDLYLLSGRNNIRSSTMPYKRKAQNYFTLAERILDQRLSLHFSSAKTIRSSLFCMRFDFYQQHTVLNKIIVYIPNRIYRKYLLNSVLFIFNKRERLRIINRLKITTANTSSMKPILYILLFMLPSFLSAQYLPLSHDLEVEYQLSSEHQLPLSVTAMHPWIVQIPDSAKRTPGRLDNTQAL